jgi:hypothetical protein
MPNGVAPPDYVAELRRQTRETFAKSHPYPFLSHDVEAADAGPSSFKTESCAQHKVRPRAAKRPPGSPRYLVLAVVKSPNNPWSDRISVGRARNNDVVIVDHSISKLHAHFSERAGSLCISDAGSSNGTRVNGIILDKGEVLRVKSGDVITFGALATKLLAADALYDWLRPLV